MADWKNVWRRGMCLLVLAATIQAQASAQAGQIESGVGTAGSGASVHAERISGVAVIIRVESFAEGPVLEADGYRIRVATGQAASITFAGRLKGIADVGPNTWIRFEGALDAAGMVVAQTARLYPAGSHKALTVMGPRKVKRQPDYEPVTQDSLLDADGHLVSAHTKVRLSDAEGPCGWHRVPADAALQERVQRVGMRVVPEYQKALPEDAPSRIPFRFYAVADDRVRSAIACNEGLILVPKNVLERLKSDDQLGAVLADAVAFNLERQLVTMTPAELGANLGAAAAIPVLFPAGYIAGESVLGVVNYEKGLKVRRDCARIALQLLADAGYDPWQAPEAWRVLAPKQALKDVGSLDYTPEGKYQLGVLKLQYKKL